MQSSLDPTCESLEMYVFQAICNHSKTLPVCRHKTAMKRDRQMLQASFPISPLGKDTVTSVASAKRTVIMCPRYEKSDAEEYKRDIRRGRMFSIKQFEKADIPKVIAFEMELRRQEPDTYYWEPDEVYRQQLEASFDDARFNTSMSFIAMKDDQVIGRIEASIIASRCDATCSSAYLDWICVLKSERHQKVAQALLTALRAECKAHGVGMLIALMASNEEAQRFYKNVDGAAIHDMGIWMEIK